MWRFLVSDGVKAEGAFRFLGSAKELDYAFNNNLFIVTVRSTVHRGDPDLHPYICVES